MQPEINPVAPWVVAMWAVRRSVKHLPQFARRQPEHGRQQAISSQSTHQLQAGQAEPVLPCEAAPIVRQTKKQTCLIGIVPVKRLCS
jgi:hypothetical protein